MGKSPDYCAMCKHYFFGPFAAHVCPPLTPEVPATPTCRSSYCECDDTARAACNARLAKADPEQAFKTDAGKPRFDLLMDGMPHALLDVTKVLTWAVEVKHYVPHSWQKVPEAKRRYRAAMQRHENKIALGETNDDESGLPHRAHIACNALFLAELDYLHPEAK